MIDDLYNRIDKKGLLELYTSGKEEGDYAERFKFTLLAGFLNKMIIVREPIYDDKQEKRAKFMRAKNIKIDKTLTLLNSGTIRKQSSDSVAA